MSPRTYSHNVTSDVPLWNAAPCSWMGVVRWESMPSKFFQIWGTNITWLHNILTAWNGERKIRRGPWWWRWTHRGGKSGIKRNIQKVVLLIANINTLKCVITVVPQKTIGTKMVMNGRRTITLLWVRTSPRCNWYVAISTHREVHLYMLLARARRALCLWFSVKFFNWDSLILGLGREQKPTQTLSWSTLAASQWCVKSNLLQFNWFFL